MQGLRTIVSVTRAFSGAGFAGGLVLGQTIVMVTHDAAAAAYGDRTVVLVDGEVTSC